ncbi:MAG: AAA family ATPase [Dehalococcoidia bacterium]|nr:AAA family ATPase [Dehalococcoidia bacterium]MDZ4245558.1 AAA family ATPase [Dehalococcoidia bacterium]
MNKVIAIVGMAGSGKSEVTREFEKTGYKRIRFGDITDLEIKRRGLKLDEKNERFIREMLREEHGMAAYALLNLPKITESLERSSVVIDGLYSWEEFKLLKERLINELIILAVYASPKTRYKRLLGRRERNLDLGDAQRRDAAEIEKINKGGPIAMADFTVVNDTSLVDLLSKTREIIDLIEGQRA